MTPKEKAKDLVNRIYQPLGNLSCNVSSNKMWEYSQKIALIAVDELINDCDASSPFDEQRIKYWNDVKYEIENQ